MRFRELQLDRNSNWRHRRAGAQPQVRSGSSRIARGRCGIYGQLYVGVHCGNAVVIAEARRYLEGHTPMRPQVGVVLGSGLGAFASELSDAVTVPYADIPGWPHSTAVGHA